MAEEETGGIWGAMTSVEIFNNAHAKESGVEYDQNDNTTHAFLDQPARTLRIKIHKCLYDGQNDAVFRIALESLCYRDAQKTL